MSAETPAGDRASSAATSYGPASGFVPRTAGAEMPARVPDFFIIGHEKCGTTALYRILRSHPQIYMPDLKEPRYFNRDPDPERAPARPGMLPRTLDAYLELFAEASASEIAGEASPQYIRSAGAARRIAELAPDARAIAILREPVSFLRSFHLACVRSGIETERDLRKALALEGLRRRGQRIPRDCPAPDRLLYADHVRYVEQLRRFEDALMPEHVHVIIYEDLRRDNERTARHVLRFLGVDETRPIDISNSTGNSRKAVRNSQLHRLGLALKRAGNRPDSAPAILRGLNSITPTWLEAVARWGVYAPPSAVSEQLTRDLRQRFRPEVAALGDHLGRDLLTDWGYHV